MSYKTGDTVALCNDVKGVPVILSNENPLNYRNDSGQDWPSPVYSKPMRAITKDDAKEYVELFDALQLCDETHWGNTGAPVRHSIQNEPAYDSTAFILVFSYNRFCIIPQCNIVENECYAYELRIPTGGGMPYDPVNGGVIPLTGPNNQAGQPSSATVTLSPTGMTVNASLPNGNYTFFKPGLGDWAWYATPVYLGVLTGCGSCSEQFSIVHAFSPTGNVEHGCDHLL